MNVQENVNFKSVSVYTAFSVTAEQMHAAGKSLHMADKKRARRIELALNLDREPEIDQVFLVDKGHTDGMELHVVTTQGIIYVYNHMKLFLGQKALVTILIARPNQLTRLYEACKLSVAEELLEKSRGYVAQGYNHC